MSGSRSELGSCGDGQSFRVDQSFEPSESGLGDFYGQAAATVFGLDVEFVEDQDGGRELGVFVFGQDGEDGLEVVRDDVALMEAFPVQFGDGEEVGVANFREFAEACQPHRLTTSAAGGARADTFDPGLGGDDGVRDQLGYCHQIASPPGSPKPRNEETPIKSGFRGCRSDRIRTCDPRFWRPVLCQLSYTPKCPRIIA